MTLKLWVQIILFTLVVSTTMRFIQLQYRQNQDQALTSDVCQFVSLSLQTGAIRTAFENMQMGLQRTASRPFCISIVEAGRSFAPNCIKQDKKYDTLFCQTEGNVGVLASVSYEQESFFNLNFLKILFLISVIILTFTYFLRFLASNLLTSVETEVDSLLGLTQSADQKPSKVARFLLSILGVKSKVSSFVSQTKAKLLDTENKLSFYVQDQDLKEKYIDKVKQIKHDIRSPLSSVQAVYETLDQNKKSTQALAAAIRRIQSLVDNLEESETNDLRKLVIAEVTLAETTASLKEKFKNTKNVVLHFSFNPESLTPILVIENDFRSAIENLLENALDAVAINGKVALGIDLRGSKCVIAVTDDGCGISDEQYRDLFSKGSTSGKINGTGLGLYKVKKTIESFGGAVICKRLSKGTQFEITLPVMQTGVVFTAVPTNKDLSIIDDDKLTAQVLKISGYRIAEQAESYEQGQALLNQASTKPVLVDYRLNNDQRGTELIASQSRRQNVFLCTNDYDSLDLIKEARAIGVKIIPKPLIFMSDTLNAGNTKTHPAPP